MIIRFVPMVLAVLTVVGCGRGEAAGVIEAAGTIEATEADLAFQVPGRIAAVEAREGQQVVEGAPLAHLDHAELEARRGAAEAQAEGARALLAELVAGFRTEEVSQARLAVAAAEERHAEQARETARTIRLAEGGAVSQEMRERAETALALAEAERNRLAEQLRMLEGGSRVERIRAQRAQVAQAEAQLRQLDAILDQQRIAAPFAGIVTLRHREPGEVVAAGAPVIRLLDPSDRWVRIYVRQDQVGRLTIGQRASIVSDGFPGREFEGEVAVIASEAEFTPRNVQTREERVKLVHAVRVRVRGDQAFELKPGLAADVTLRAPLP